MTGCVPRPNPVLNPAVGLSPVEGGYLAYDSAADTLHELNALGALLAELCDGSRSADEIRALVGPLMPEGQTTGIDDWLNAGIEAGLLIWGDGTTVRPRELSAEELIGLVNKLRETGMSESYFLCLKRVTELTPENSDMWHSLGFAAQAIGRREAARDAFAQYLDLQPEDATIRQMLTALRDETPPPRASNECILQIFNDFSSHYDSKMRDNLSYQAPERVQELIQAGIGDVTGLEILDIGCGTGLSGVSLRERAARLVGIDLSPEMIKLAQERGIYDQLEVAEITEWLDQSTAQFDLIVCCDCLVYFGDLQPVAEGAAKRLKLGGCFAFTTERGEKYPFHLLDSGRYSHHADYIRDVAAKAGLVVGRLEEGFLRTERGVEVTGLLALLRKAGG